MTGPTIVALLPFDEQLRVQQLPIHRGALCPQPNECSFPEQVVQVYVKKADVDITTVEGASGTQVTNLGGGKY